MNVQWYAVGFFDLLGQREQMKQLMLRPPQRMDAEYGLRYKKLVDPVLKHRDLFQKAIEESKRRWRDYVPPAQLEEDVRQELRRLLVPDINLQFLADSVVLWTAMSDGANEPRVLGLMEMISAAAIVSLSLLGGKITLRGGISVNAGGTLRSGDFYGPVAGAAYEAEGKLAVWPRVVLDDHAMSFLRTARGLPPSSAAWKATRHVAEECASMLCNFDDQVPMVDSFGPKFIEPKNDPLLAVPEFVEGLTWVRAEHERFQRSGPKEVALKYRKLREYIDSRLSAPPGDLSNRRGCLS